MVAYCSYIGRSHISIFYVYVNPITLLGFGKNKHLQAVHFKCHIIFFYSMYLDPLRNLSNSKCITCAKNVLSKKIRL